MLTTAIIAGHRLTLESGVRYVASRPFASREPRDYPVTIEPVGAPEGVDVGWVMVSKLSWEQANDLVNAFNNGPTSFEGRVWE